MEKTVKEKMYLNGEEFLIMIELSKLSENYDSRELLCDENKQWLDNVIKISKNYNWKLVLEKDNVEKRIYTYSFKTTKVNKWINDRYIKIKLNYGFMEKFKIMKESNPLNQFTRKYNLGGN
jgi:predicted nuclease with TOPRIM domain